MKNFIKVFIIFISILNLQLYSSAPLTKENLKRNNLGLPLKKLPENNQILQQKRRPLTREQRYDLGVSYLRAARAKQVLQKIQKFCKTLEKFSRSRKTPDTQREQEKLTRDDSSKRYPSLEQHFKSKCS